MNPVTRLFALVLLGSSAAAQNSSGELLTNPGAESGTMGWTDALGHGFEPVHLSTLPYVGVVEGSCAFWAGMNGPVGAYVQHRETQAMPVVARNFRCPMLAHRTTLA